MIARTKRGATDQQDSKPRSDLLSRPDMHHHHLDHHRLAAMLHHQGHPPQIMVSLSTDNSHMAVSLSMDSLLVARVAPVRLAGTASPHLHLDTKYKPRQATTALSA